MELTKNNFLEAKFNTRALKFLILTMLLVLLIGINNTHIYYASLNPFGVGIVFALMYIGFNGYILSSLFSISMLFNIGVHNCIHCVNVVLVLALMQLIIDKKKLKLKKLYLFFSSMVALVGFTITNVGGAKENLAVVVAIVLALLFLYSSLIFLDATIGKGMLGHINLDEKICGCVILILFCIGISDSYIHTINLGLVFSCIVIQSVCRLSSGGTTLIAGVLVGIGFSVHFLNPVYVSMFVVITLATIAFKCNCKYLSVIAYLMAYIIFCLLFNIGMSGGEIVSVVIGAIISCFIPSKLLTAFSEIFAKSRPVAMQNIFNSAKSELVRRVKDLSLVFAEMDKVYRGMVKGNMSDEHAKEILREETISGVCDSCQNKDNCFRNVNSFMDNCFDTFVSVGYDKGRLLLVDLPEYLTTNCIKTSYLVSYFNNLLSAYLDYEGAVTNIDTSRILIAEQLGGVSKLLESLSKEVDINVSIGNKFEGIIKERLGYSGIVCIECVVYEKDINNTIINIIVKDNHISVKKIEKIVSKVFNVRFGVVVDERSQLVGARSLVLKNSDNYDVAFGSSICTKTGKMVSGDSHSVISIGEGKYIMSICDGMGSGKKANKLSTLTLSLIENFYRAGFDNDIILSSVNKLLSLNEQENFSTIDLCVIDCKKNFYDFIKLGASDGYIKHSTGEIDVIHSNNLPIGVLEDIKPHITKLCVCPMDIVVLVSDGVSDVLGESLKDIIRFSDNINPQGLADEILTLALDRSGGVSNDDMTVVCVRVFEFV